LKKNQVLWKSNKSPSHCQRNIPPKLRARTIFRFAALHVGAASGRRLPRLDDFELKKKIYFLKLEKEGLVTIRDLQIPLRHSKISHL
jgi:hypothetical protein